jgi:hypothetical protein
MTTAFIITFLTYLVAGAVPPIVAYYVLRVSFLGGAPAATLVGILAAVIGGLIDTIFLAGLPDLVVIAGAVDVVPPVVASLLLTILYALVSSSNA